MAQAVEREWRGRSRARGHSIRVCGAVRADRNRGGCSSHSRRGRDAGAERMLEAVADDPDDLVVCVISGRVGAASFAGTGTDSGDQAIAGARAARIGRHISEINCVRRHLSGIKGGRLAAACHPARVITLLISDVPAIGRSTSHPVPRWRIQPVARMRSRS